MKNRGSLCLVLTLAALNPLAAGSLLLAEDLHFDSNGVKIRYTLDGEGPPVLLIHGYTANGDLNWRLPQTVRLLADDYQVITLDNRGHGKSDKPEADGEYGIKMVADAVGLLDHLGIKQAHVVGYSMGGLITMKLLVDHPQRVRSAVVGGMGWLDADAERAKSYATAAPRSANKAMTACLRGFGEFAITRQELMAIKVPTTVLIGSEDGLFETSVQPLQEVRPDIPVVVIKGANHTACSLRPEFRQEIKEFLDRQESEPTS